MHLTSGSLRTCTLTRSAILLAQTHAAALRQEESQGRLPPGLRPRIRSAGAGEAGGIAALVLPPRPHSVVGEGEGEGSGILPRSSNTRVFALHATGSDRPRPVD